MRRRRSPGRRRRTLARRQRWPWRTAEEKSADLDTSDVAGDSATAMENAQAVLTAQMDVMQAVTDAQDALDSATTAKTEAEGLPDGNAHKARLIVALDEAIEEAETQVEEATKIRDGRALERYGEDVTGGEDADPQGTPRSIANKVGMDIAMALVPIAENNGAGTRVTHGDGAPATTVAKALKVERDNRMGMTWGELVGADNIEMMPIGEMRANLPVTSVAGMTAAEVNATLTRTNGDNTLIEYDDTFATEDPTATDYEGIPGTVYCLGSDCEVDRDGRLTGSWYFTPAEASDHYIDNPNRDAAVETPYVEETSFANFGHWLVVVGTDTEAWTVMTYSNDEGGVVYTLAEDDDLGESATYKGKAAGMSVYKTDSADPDAEDKDINSGRFTADVTLTATFGMTSTRPTPTIGGTIDGFDGPAVSTGWSVDLRDATLATGGTETENARTVATGADGVWSNSAYGDVATERPAGVHGGFTAHFTDGHAAGAYATLKE